MFALLTEPTSYLDTTILNDISTVISKIPEWIGSNKYLIVFFTIFLVMLGLKMFHSMKRVVD